MILPVVKYGHPALRQKGDPIAEITPELRRFAADMLETMYAAEGVGLAAQQVGRPLQLTVLDVSPVTDRPSSLTLNGEPARVDQHMPLVLINPEITPLNEPEEGPEGCLSFPEIYADINRPESIEVKFLDLEGQPRQFRCGGLLSRAIQHEYDHLQGILFIDRMPLATKQNLKPELEALQKKTKTELARASD